MPHIQQQDITVTLTVGIWIGVIGCTNRTISKTLVKPYESWCVILLKVTGRKVDSGRDAHGVQQHLGDTQPVMRNRRKHSPTIIHTAVCAVESGHDAFMLLAAFTPKAML